MSDDLISRNALSEESSDKVRVSSAEIVVHGTKEKPYYEIEYFDLSDSEMHIGFSSYKLDVVFGYLEKYFDIVNEKEQEKIRNRFTGDLISRKAVISLIDELGYINVSNRDDFKTNCRVDKIRQRVVEFPTAFDKEKVNQELKSNMESAQLAQSLVGTDLVQCGGFSYGYYNGVKDAVKIVEKGGIE